MVLAVEGELAAAELDLEVMDELISSREPLHYDLEVSRMEDALLVLESRLHAARAELAPLPESAARTSLLDLTVFLQQQAAGVASAR